MRRHHAGAYSLICPSVALFVFGVFWLAFGLMKNGLVERFSLMFFVLMVPLAWIQLKSPATLLRLNRKLLPGRRAMAG